MNKQKAIPGLYMALSFIIPALIILAALAGLQVTPFGDNTLMISDGNGLYINYLGYVARAFKGQESILFSFEKGLGGNMMGSWGWFFLNPTFALFSLFDITQYPQAYTLVSLLNFCLCGLTMYILLKDCYGHRFSNLMFSTAYALNGFLVANVFQLNFFACIPVLPIMVMGLRRILNDKNPLIYVLSLGYSLLMNFYFGFMLCVASFLIFVIVFVAYRRTIEDKKSVTVKYIFSSLLAGALSSVVWLPALLSLRGGRLDQSVAYAISFAENMPFLDMGSKLFMGANTTSELQNGLPNIFVGLLPVALLILFFMNHRINRTKKAAAGVLLVVYFISFYLSVINLLMHGGTVTNWFNYRDSFVFSFFLLMISADEWQYITEEPAQNIKRTAIILVIGTILVFSKKYSYVTGGEAMLDFIILAVMFLAYWMYKRNPKKNPKHVMEMVVLVLLCLELFLNYEFSTKKIMGWTHTQSEYQEVVTPVSAMVDAVKNSDESFYRMEIGEQRSGNQGNDPMLYGYNGVGHGGSDDRDFVRSALSYLGIRHFNMRSSYYDSVPAATDSLLGLKYIISKEDLEREKGYEHLVDIGRWTLYQNPIALSVAMLGDSRIETVETDLTDVFDNINQVYSALTGKQECVFIEENSISFSAHNIITSAALTQGEAAQIVAARDLSLSSSESDAVQDNEDASESSDIFEEYKTRGSLTEEPENSNYIMFTWVADRDGTVYTYNRSGVTEGFGSPLPAVDCLGYYHKGETVTGYLPMENSLVTQYLLEEVAGRFRAAYADNDTLVSLIEIIRERPATIEKLTDSHLRGEFTAEAGQKLILTIPYDEGWTCYIDGKETEINKVLGVFMAVDAPEGTHSYEMKFVPTGLRMGTGLSATALLTTLAYIPIDSRRRKKKTCQRERDDNNRERL